jgi:hypothetical protein
MSRTRNALDFTLLFGLGIVVWLCILIPVGKGKINTVLYLQNIYSHLTADSPYPAPPPAELVLWGTGHKYILEPILKEGSTRWEAAWALIRWFISWWAFIAAGGTIICLLYDGDGVEMEITPLGLLGILLVLAAPWIAWAAERVFPFIR